MCIRDRLSTVVPVENAAMDDRTIIQWDKDDLETMKLLKVDCLALGMLTCIRKAVQLVERHRGYVIDIARIPNDDKPTYAMIPVSYTHLDVYKRQDKHFSTPRSVNALLPVSTARLSHQMMALRSTFICLSTHTSPCIWYELPMAFI